ncbi:MAG: glycerol-3-phosphate dehydrogenase subunit GlpB [Spirochaetes bacterium]|nr:glycerol-3-phosphate dehydrogenase subunit GlpB [Spirochaetota bacterium]
MNYDCIIIGGGIAGLTCGIKCLKEGLSCAVISSGMSALHFSSGSIDVFGYDEQSRPVDNPFNYIEKFTALHGHHPYAKCGPDNIKEALFFFKDALAEEGLELHHNSNENHFIISTLGILKPSFFSQRSVYNEEIGGVFGKKSKIAFLNFDGYRDFYPDITIANLKKNALFKDTDFISGNILFPDYGSIKKNPFEFRSVDIARIFDTSRYLEDIAKQIKNKAAHADIVCFPAFIGISNFKKHHEALQELTGKLIYEIPALPPSLPGMRIDNALKSRFASLGGVFIAGDRVISGVIKNGMLENVRTANNMNEVLKSHCYVLASGSFFSGGMTSDSASIREPVFNLRVEYSPNRGDWASDKLFDKNSHKFIEYGVETNDSMNPFGADGSSISNMFCAGAILPHYNPVKDACGSGVAISTGYCAAKNIVNRIKGSKDRK